MVLTPWSQDSHGLRLKQPAYLHVFSFGGYVAISAKYKSTAGVSRIKVCTNFKSKVLLTSWSAKKHIIKDKL